MQAKLLRSSRPQMKKRSIFVTVGTTRFDILVEAVSQPSALKWMASNGYTHLVIQFGKGVEPALSKNAPISCRSYAFQPSLEEDMEEADLIVSHAGAGTVMEALRLQKRLVVVINTLLMDNHQTELASAMAQRGHLFVVEHPHEMNQIQTWSDLERFVPKINAGGDEWDFPRLLRTHLGIGER